MTPIFAPGNDKGFVLLDALLCLFLAGIMLLAAYGSISSVLRLSSTSIERGRAIIEERNNSVMEGRISHE
jgi:type II secretory pathway component PulJ